MINEASTYVDFEKYAMIQRSFMTIGP